MSLAADSVKVQNLCRSSAGSSLLIFRSLCDGKVGKGWELIDNLDGIFII